VLTDPFGKTLVLQVEDSGPGVPLAERELIFRPFYRALGTEVDGSGLGLRIVMEIAYLHNATVAMEDTRPGQVPPGARFNVRFVAESGATAIAA
jgi:two-component system sensor histidine kinase TctE